MSNNIVLKFLTECKDGASATLKGILNVAQGLGRNGSVAVLAMSKAFGNLSGSAGLALNAVRGFFSGGIWGAGSQLVGIAIGKIGAWIKDWRQSLEDAKLAAKGLSKEFMTLDARQRGYQRRIEQIKNAARERAKAEQEAAAAAKKAAEEVIALERQRLALQEKYYSVEQRIAAENDATALLGMDGDDAAKKRYEIAIRKGQEGVDAARRRLTSIEKTDGKYSMAYATAEKELELALAAQKRIKAEASKMLKDYTDSKLAAAAAAQEEKDRIKAEQEAAERREKAAKDEARIREDGAKKLKELEDKIAAAKERAAQLEANAARARGKSFGQWMREERNDATDRRAADRKQANREKAVAQELARLEDINPRARTAWQRARIDKLREWQADQDPANNPAFKEAAKLQQQRDELQKQMVDELKEIKQRLADATTL